jgi:alkanesulfonate monooxygenase SsuD/methylene tetrahydromethanopterin reductase-like flavin-dependent oxidoreductase (luciferase family)
MIRYAIGLPTVGEFGDPGRLRDLAVLAEESGWDGVYLWDHILFHNADWPVANPTVTAAAVAAATSRIRIMMACALARRRVAVVARETVALDVLSDGRLTLVTPLGSLDLEWSGFGEPADLRARGAALTRKLDDLVRLWSGEPVVVGGATEPVQMVPPPVQRPRIPIWCGGTWPNRKPLRRAARFDGAMPTFLDQKTRRLPPEEFAAATAYLAEHREGLAGSAGGAGQHSYDVALEGSTDPAEAAEVISSYVDAGLTWWVEEMGWWRVPADAPPGAVVSFARDRIAAGPPR